MLSLSLRQGQFNLKVVLNDQALRDVFMDFAGNIAREIRQRKSYQVTETVDGIGERWSLEFSMEQGESGVQGKDVLFAFTPGTTTIPLGQPGQSFEFELDADTLGLGEDFYKEMINRYFPEAIEKHKGNLFNVVTV